VQRHGLIDRHMRPIVAEALQDSRGVAIVGARQVGKSTLAGELARLELGATQFNLDDEPTRRAALSDPVGFVAALSGPAVIDEIQRAPDLLLAMKERMDADPTPGQFLITGSANLLALSTVHDALPGRIVYLTLRPLSQGEMLGRREDFIDRLFTGEFPRVADIERGRAGYARRIVAGGYPEVFERSPRARSRFFSSYVASIVGRDLPTVGRVHNPQATTQLLRLLATRSAQLTNFNSMANDLGIDQKTATHYADLLAQLYLAHQVPAWHSNLGQRQIKSPKAYIPDTGLLAYLTGTDEQRLADDPSGNLAGMFFETFVAMELLRQSEWAEHEVQLYHYRDRAQREVDLVLERNSGDAIGVEVKAAATASERDFRGLQFLRDKLGGSFKAGAVLYTGDKTLPFGDRLAAVPIAGLWSDSP
jgi:predicted AAA+ superfamily ATPase